MNIYCNLLFRVSVLRLTTSPSDWSRNKNPSVHLSGLNHSLTADGRNISWPSSGPFCVLLSSVFTVIILNAGPLNDMDRHWGDDCPQLCECAAEFDLFVWFQFSVLFVLCVFCLQCLALTTPIRHPSSVVL